MRACAPVRVVGRPELAPKEALLQPQGISDRAGSQDGECSKTLETELRICRRNENLPPCCVTLDLRLNLSEPFSHLLNWDKISPSSESCMRSK